MQLVNYKQVPQILNIIIDNKIIEQVKSTNFLGVTLDSNLNWKLHIDN
jgi:hypothetical protein